MPVGAFKLLLWPFRSPLPMWEGNKANRCLFGSSWLQISWVCCSQRCRAQTPVGTWTLVPNMRPYSISAAQEGSVGSCAYCHSSRAGEQCWCHLLQDMNPSFPVFCLFLPTHQPWLQTQVLIIFLAPQGRHLLFIKTHHFSFFFLSHFFLSLSPAQDTSYETWKGSLKSLKITGQTSAALTPVD